MALPPKDSEERVREVRDKLVRGLTKEQASTGMIPSAEPCNDWATNILEQLVRERDDRRAKGEEGFATPASVAEEKETPPPDFPSGFRVPEGLKLTTKPVGTYNFGTKVFKPTATGTPSRRGRKKRKALAELSPQDRRNELVRRRLAMLANFPFWHGKVIKAWFWGPPSGTSVEDFQRTATENVMKVLEESNKLFGDWRVPAQRQPLIIVGA